MAHLVLVPGITRIESDLSPEARGFLGTQWNSIASVNITVHLFDPSPVPFHPFHTPICQNCGGGSDPLQSFTVDNHIISENQDSSQATSSALNQHHFLSPLPPLSPLRDTELQSGVSSSVTQTSPMSTLTAQLSSSPTKPCRNHATQKDPVYSCVRGAAKGSQLWGTFLVAIQDFCLSKLPSFLPLLETLGIGQYLHLKVKLLNLLDITVVSSKRLSVM
ncbi:hypothetical protein GYMLUDRAFT_59666 [Collybiopsis luxurians FD-317 M1]|uniref:Uncharacterized protein n=1 Tax=Collybiopsis luxurians FD-317 M1 TaxID=944289 RepID=A0A0D0CVV5_9AGAR|nr:hypothetical protein GYMLUDRAFT_59666 [Collybiopsis luxurians FD-317 M1]